MGIPHCRAQGVETGRFLENNWRVTGTWLMRKQVKMGKDTE